MAVIASEGRLWQVRHDVMLECNKRIRRVVTDCAFQAGARREALLHFDTCEGDKRVETLRISPPTSPSELTVGTIKHSCIMLSLFLSTRFFMPQDKLSTLLADSRICIFFWKAIFLKSRFKGTVQPTLTFQPFITQRLMAFSVGFFLFVGFLETDHQTRNSIQWILMVAIHSDTTKQRILNITCLHLCASDYAVVKFDSKYYITRTFFIFCYVSLCFFIFFYFLAKIHSVAS